MLTRRALLLLLFFASGASGLIYELVWIRQFGTLLGSSVYSAAVVTALYMCGLGFGAWLTGAWIDRRFQADPRSPLRWYAVFELGIGSLAALAMILVPLLAPISAASASYELGAHGWYGLSLTSSLVRYGLAAVLLLPITLLMGGTLTLLIRYVVSDDASGVGWQVGLLYGVNTAGAALGCLLTDTSLVPLLGLQSTQMIAVGMNALAAAGAWGLSLRTSASGSQPVAAPADTPDAPDARARVAWVATALALTGFATMAMQIVWYRQLISIFAAFRPVFSILLTIILVGIWLGSLIGGRLARRADPALLYALFLLGFVLSALFGLSFLEHSSASYGVMPEESIEPFWRWPTLYARLLREIAWVVGPPALFAGAAFPVGNAMAQSGGRHVGARAGLLYLANTLGGVLGSLVAGFVLLPRLGIQATVGVVLLLALAALLCMWRVPVGASAGPAPRRRLLMATSAVGVLALSGWAMLPSQFLLYRSLPLPPNASGRGILAVNEGVNETLVVLQQKGPILRLVTNGFSMSGTSFGALRYMHAFAHVPMLLRDDIENVMVMCFGVGNTASAILMHPDVERLDVVDLSQDVLLHADQFEAVNGRPLEDERVRVHVNDARHHLHMLGEARYDLVTGEPPPIAHAGVVNLYTREFFELVRSRLRPDGMVTYWLPLGQVGEAASRSMVRAFLDVFPDGLLLSGYRDELMLVGRNGDGPIQIDPEAVERRMAAVPGLRDALRGIGLDTPIELVGMLAGTTPTLERATRDAPPLRDDHPTLEYALRAVQKSPRIPRDLVSVDDLELWCPRCFEGGLEPDEEAQLRGYLDVIARYYRSEAFLASARGTSPLAPDEPLSLAERSAVAHSLYLQDLLLALPEAHLRAIQLERHGRIDLAVPSLESLVREQPGNWRARQDLAWLRRRAATSSTRKHNPTR